MISMRRVRKERSLPTAAIKDEERRKEEKALDRSILCRRKYGMPIRR